MFGKEYKQKVEQLEIDKRNLQNQSDEQFQTIQMLKRQIEQLKASQAIIPDCDYLEVYMFRLMSYIFSVEFQEIKSQGQARILAEFEYIKNSFSIVKNLYPKKESIIAYRADSEEDFEDDHFVYSFSNIDVASKVLGCKKEEIIWCISGIQAHSNHYVFEYELDWLKSQPTQSSIVKLNSAWERSENDY